MFRYELLSLVWSLEYLKIVKLLTSTAISQGCFSIKGLIRILNKRRLYVVVASDAFSLTPLDVLNDPVKEKMYENKIKNLLITSIRY